MRLPDGLEKQIWQAIETIEEDKKMRYVSSVERFGIEKGVLQGRIEGRQEGRQEGRLQGRQEGELRVLKKLLERRFGTLTTSLQEQLNNATEADLDRWTEVVLSARTVDDIFNT
jgi:flagellar biosynthesis/type III secretory pathway protein FliH